MEWCERTVISSKFFGHRSYLFVIFKVISHELKERLLFCIKFNLSLKIVTVFLKLLISILVDLNFILE